MRKRNATHDNSHLESIEVDLEYMIVDKRNFLPRNIASSILHELETSDAASGSVFSSIRVSPTLTQHSLKLSNRRAEGNYHRLETLFVDAIRELNTILENVQAMLMPGSVHPTLLPKRGVSLYDGPSDNPELKLAREIDHKRHAWLNNQCACFRIRYRNEQEFVRTQDALLLLLSKLPALAAASPYLEGDVRESLDTRCHFLSRKHREFPSITGDYIPERVASVDEYKTLILAPMLEERIELRKALSNEGIERLNGRAFVPLFSRNKIEVRILGTQEAPSVDLAIMFFLVKVLQQLLDLPPSALARAASRSNTRKRKRTLLEVATLGAEAELHGPSLDAIFKLGRLPVSARNFWSALLEKVSAEQSMDYGFETISFLIEHGPLATRMKQLGGNFNDVVDATRLLAHLASGLTANRMLAPTKEDSLKNA